MLDLAVFAVPTNDVLLAAADAFRIGKPVNQGVVESRPAFHAEFEDASNRGDAPYELETVSVARDCSASGHEVGKFGRILRFLRRTVPKKWDRFRDRITDNFRIISPDDFRVVA